MAALTNDQILEAVGNMTVLEISDLVKAMEEKFDVSAAAPVMVAGAGAAAGSEVEEQTEFDVILTGFGEKKIAVIKAVREISGLGLKEAKELAESGGDVVKGADKAKADEAKSKLEAAGATVELK